MGLHVSKCLEMMGEQIPGMSSKASELFILMCLEVAFEHICRPQAKMGTLKQAYKCHFWMI